MKSIGKILKELRINNNLTQKEFAKKFFLTDNTIGNYETGIRTPSVEFLMQVCDEFNITLDYFMERPKIESNPCDLVVSEKNRKFAIYDKKQSIYLTQHIYQEIVLSKFGYHVAINRKKMNVLINGEVHEDMGTIEYSAMIDNFGNVHEYEGIQIGNNGFFDRFGNVVAYSEKLNKVVLMNANGDILSKGYDGIRRVSALDYLELEFGLCYGINFSKEKGERILNIKLLNNKGEELNLNFNTNKIKELDLENVFPFEIKEFKNLSFLIASMKKESIELIKFAPNSILECSENYYKILNAIIEDDEVSDEEKRLKIHFLIGVFTNAIDIYSPYLHEIIPFDFMPNLNFKNKIIESTEKRMLENFYSNKLHFISDLQVIKNIENIKNLKIFGNYICQKDNKYYFANRFSHVMFRNKNIDKGDVNENLYLEFEKYVLNFCDVFSSIENKPSIMIFNNFTDPNEITKKLGESYYNIEDIEEINLLHKKPTVYIHSD